MTVKTPALLQVQYAVTLPDNSTGDISPVDVRQSQVDQTDTWDALKVDETEDVVPRWNAGEIQGQTVDSTVPTDKQILVFNDGTGEWEPKNSFKSSGLLSLVDNAVATVISTVNTPVKINPATFTAFNLADFAQSTNGRLTYLGAVTMDFIVSASVSLFEAGGTKVMTVYIAKNGAVINDSKVSSNTLTLKPTSVSTFFIVSLATNDFIELFVENNDTTDDITCTDTRFMVSTL